MTLDELGGYVTTVVGAIEPPERFEHAQHDLNVARIGAELRTELRQRNRAWPCRALNRPPRRHAMTAGTKTKPCA